MWGEEGSGLCEVGHEDRQENPRLEDQVGRQGRCVQEVQAALWEGRPDLIISNPEKKDEYDIVAIFPYGDSVGMIFIEVKNWNSYLWDTTEFAPSRSLFEGNCHNMKKRREPGSWGQLGKSDTFFSELFADILINNVHAFTALPNTSRQVLEDKLGQSCCSQHVLTLPRPKRVEDQVGTRRAQEANQNSWGDDGEDDKQAAWRWE